MDNFDRARNNSQNALSAVKDFLSEIGWDPQRTKNDEILIVDFEADNTPIANAIFEISMIYERFVCYFNFKNKTVAARHKEVVEFILRANFNLIIGNFEINMDDGFIRFKSSVDFTEMSLGKILIRNTIKSAMDVVEKYADGLEEVILGGKTAQEAIFEAESGSE